MDKNLIDYFAKNKEKYLKFDLKYIIENIQIDILNDYPEIMKPESKTLIVVESLEDALRILNFNWLRDLTKRNELVWFHNNEPISSLNLFFELNKKYFISLKKNKFEVVNSIIENWQYFISEALSNTGFFKNKLFNTNLELLFLKTINSKEWLSNPESFITKRFGDKASEVYVNFIYKEGDQDFETNNLEENILKFKKQQLSRVGVCGQSSELYKLIKKAKLFSFKDGLDFKNSLLKNNLDFPKNGIYLMFEIGEDCNEQKRIVRIGINKGGLLINRLNKHINGSKRTSIFRMHLWRILCNNDSEDAVTDYIKKNIKFCIISGPENKDEREVLESKIIGTVSNCKECYFSVNWLGLKSKTRKIRESGLWNVSHVFSENNLDDKDLKFISNNLYDK